MDDQNLNMPVTPSSTQNGSEATNNPGMTEVVRVDVGSDTRAISEADGSEIATVKRGRGRPRKYEIVRKPISPTPVSQTPALDVAIQADGSDVKRGRGRPRGSGKFQILASIGGDVAMTAGGNMTPHVLTVNPGEDVVGKIFAFVEKGPRAAVCILSASGTVSSVILRQPALSGGFLRYEGRFEIISLSGSYTFTNGSNRKIGMLSVTLAKPDGRVFGGAIENSLIAATPIQLVLATFKQNISNQIKRKNSPISSTTPNLNTPESARENNLKVPKLTIEEPVTTIIPETNCNDDLTEAAENNVVAETTTNGVTVTDNVKNESGADSQTLESGTVDVNTLPLI